MNHFNFQWTPNFYLVLVGPPGIAAKSTSIAGGMSLLAEVPGIYFGPQSGTWQALLEVLQNAQEVVPIPGQNEPEVMSCVTMVLSELGTFFRGDNNELIDVLVDMWDGKKGVWRRQTKTQGHITIHNAWLNIISCTTPSWLKDNLPEIFISGGLASRMLFVYENKKRRLVAYPGYTIDPKQHRIEQQDLISDLNEIANILGEYKLSPEALAWGEKWYATHWEEERPAHLRGERFDGYHARKQAHIHKLAMVIAASKRNELLITHEDLLEAYTLVSSLETNMVRVFDAIAGTLEGKKNTALVDYLRTQKEIEYTKLWRVFFSSMSGAEFTEAIQAGIHARYIQVEVKGTDRILRYVGPPE
jgi:hypothetical protein